MPGPGVRADHRAETDDELELRLRPPFAHELLELGRPLGGGGVRDGEPELRLVPRLGLEGGDQLRERVPLAADALHRHDLAVRMERIGLTLSSVPAKARALPMRPPRARNSSVSTVNSSPRSRRYRSTSSSTSSSLVPRSRRRWIASASIAIEAEAVSESITVTRPSPSSAAAASALANVPETSAETWSEKIRS